MDEEALSWFVDYDIAAPCYRLKVWCSCSVGGVTRQVEVELDPEKLLALNATATILPTITLDPARCIWRSNQDGGSEQSIRTIATVKQPKKLGQWILHSVMAAISLDQVAPFDGIAERRSAALLNGQPVIGFEITQRCQ